MTIQSAGINHALCALGCAHGAGDHGAGGPGDAATSHDAGDRAPSPDGSSAGIGSWITGTFSNASGQRDYRLYVPSGYRAGMPAPLVVMLHGCAVTAEQMDAATAYSVLAEARGFLVVYPIQSIVANPSLCWNWFLSQDQSRGGGEPSLIAGIVQQIGNGWSVDAKRVYVIGGSAGGAMAVIMGASYPDVFAAIGVVAGCEYGGVPCGPLGGPDPTTQGGLAYKAMMTSARPVAAVVFHGDADVVAAPINGDQVVQQWIATDDYADDGAHDGSVPTTPASTMTLMAPGGRSYDRKQFDDRVGALLIDYYVVHGAGHAWPGGPASSSYTDPMGPGATAISYDFFLAHARR
jgi:poly(hydroxyalkanoate) depolymerase family esterase